MFCALCGNKLDEDVVFCAKCGHRSLDRQRKPLVQKKYIIVSTILFIITLLYLIGDEDLSKSTASSVVNIYCQGESSEGSSGGSGTIFSEDGLVLTNAHIIPQNLSDGGKCLITLPDPITGAPKEIYYAYPIIIPNLSEKYDLAFMQIHDVFYDQEEGRVYGEYPRNFPAYLGRLKCSESTVKLGEPIKVYGYPAISGGYALTITDGVVSSLLVEEGLIITSAKISYGNSGGLAVDKDGCMIGVPSMVTGDENESLGIIISTDLIFEFAEEAMAYSKN